jgi:hypothetical protein
VSLRILNLRSAMYSLLLQMKDIVADALATAGVNTNDRLDQFQFAEALKKVVTAVADRMEQAPVQVAHSEKVYDGKGIVSFLKERANFQTVRHLSRNNLFLYLQYGGKLPPEVDKSRFDAFTNEVTVNNVNRCTLNLFSKLTVYKMFIIAGA